MSNSTRDDEQALHEKVLRRDSVAAAEVFEKFMDRISRVLVQEMPCDEETAYDAMVDALFSYIGKPELYEPEKGRLISYLMQAAKKQVLTKLRKRGVRDRAEKKDAEVVELSSRNPKEEMENYVEATIMWERLLKSGYVKDERDIAALRLILLRERSTEAFAKAWGLISSSFEELSKARKEEVRKEVKRNLDRLKKLLERFGKKEYPDDES